jgi:hypothetical protein
MAEATIDPLLAANSRVAAVVDPAPPSPLLAPDAPAPKPPEIIFETEREITLARARIAAFFSLDPGSDAFADHTSRLSTGFTLFDELGPVEHALYAGHNQLLALAGTAEVQLSVELGPVRTGLRPLGVDWEYLSEDGWLPLASDPADGDGTDGFTHDGQIILNKTCGPDAKEETIAGHKSYWIRGRLRGPLLPEGDVEAGATPLLESVRAGQFHQGGLARGSRRHGRVRARPSTNFFPFSKQPESATRPFTSRARKPFSDVARGCGSASSFLKRAREQRKAALGILLRAKLAVDRNLRVPGTVIGAFAQSGEVSFRCPPDWSETAVGGAGKSWLRARLDEGNYGEPLKLSVEGSGTTTTVKAVPSTLEASGRGERAVAIRYQTDVELLDHCLSFNDFTFADHARLPLAAPHLPAFPPARGTRAWRISL